MLLVSYAQLDCGDRIVLDGRAEEPFTVVAVHDDKAWVRQEASGIDLIVHLEDCALAPTWH